MAALFVFLASALAGTLATPAGAVEPDVMLAGVQAPEGNGHLAVSVNGKIFPPPNVLGQEFPQNIEVDCKGCYTRGGMSIGAGGNQLGINYTPGPNFTSPYVQAAHFDFDNTWVGFAIGNFDVHFELLVQFSPANDANAALVIHLLGEPRNIPVPEIPGLAITFDPQVRGAVNVKTAVNFTFGFEVKVPAGSTLLIPIAHPEEFIAVGFNETTVTAIPFQSSLGDLAMDFQLSFRAAFSLGIDTLFGLPTLTLEDNLAIFADLPKLDVAISQVTNATAACAPPGAGDHVFSRLTKVAARIGMDVGLDFDGKEYTPLGFSAPVASAAPVQCSEYDSKAQRLVAPGSSDQDKGEGKGKDNDGKNAALLNSQSPILLVVASILTATFFI